MFEATTTHNALRSEKRPNILPKWKWRFCFCNRYLITKCQRGLEVLFKLNQMILAHIKDIKIVKFVGISLYILAFLKNFRHFMATQPNVHRPRGMAHQRQGSNFFCCLRAECQKFSATTILLLRGVVTNYSKGSTMKQKLKALLRKNVLNDVTAALFLVSFSHLPAVKKHRKWCSSDVIKNVHISLRL